MLAHRLITAAIGIPLIALSIWIGNELLAAVVALAAFIATLEIAAARGVARTPGGILTAVSAAIFPVVALGDTHDLAGAAAGAIIVLSILLSFTLDPKASIDGWLWGIVSVLYFGFLAAHFILLREMAEGRDLLLLALLTVWIGDTGAYFIGSLVGRRKLAPAISPGKTVEGAIGSFLWGFAAVFAIHETMDLAGSDLHLATEHLVALGLIVPTAALFGDLAESAVKRALGVKDSSVLVPGHGGVADRLDSLLFAIPAVYWYTQWIVL